MIAAMDRVPSYAELPISPDAPAGSAWGVFGRDDQVGTLNLLTPEVRAAAAKLAVRGATFNLDMPLHLPARPFFGNRSRPKHTILRWGNGTVQDDYLDGFYPQYSSQWDALRHIRNPEHGFYNWTTDEQAAAEEGRLGVENFAQHGIVGRGVLLDAVRYLATQGETLAPDAYSPLTGDLLDAVAAGQGVAFHSGDIVLLRTGVGAMQHREAAEGLSTELRKYEGPGLDQGDESLAWMWDHHFAAIVSDNLSVEAFPFRQGAKNLHHWAIAMLGMVFGELFDLEALADDCAAHHTYECLFVAKPLMLRGGVGSSANALALK